MLSTPLPVCSLCSLKNTTRKRRGNPPPLHPQGSPRTPPTPSYRFQQTLGGGCSGACVREGALLGGCPLQPRSSLPRVNFKHFTFSRAATALGRRRDPLPEDAVDWVSADARDHAGIGQVVGFSPPSWEDSAFPIVSYPPKSPVHSPNWPLGKLAPHPPVIHLFACFQYFVFYPL